MVDAEQVLTTQRLRLEPIRPAHADELFEGLSDPTLYTYIDEPPPAAIESLRERYGRLSTRRSPDGSTLWLNWACRERDSGQMVGTVQATVPPRAPPLLAYVFVATGQGRGLAREACAAVARLLFDAYDASRIEATVDSDNTRSRRLLASLGFARASEGDARETSRGTVRECRYRLERASRRFSPA